MGDIGEKLQSDFPLDPEWRVAIVSSKFNSAIVSRMEEGAFSRLAELGWAQANIERLRVPGAVEIPLAAKWALQSGCDAVVALGAVIRGETDHYEYVCNAVERGCSQLQLEFGQPVAFGVLTTENREQAMARSGGSKGNKGAEAVDVVVEMLNLKKSRSF